MRERGALMYVYSNDLKAYRKKCCNFWLHSKVKFLTCVVVVKDLVITTYFLSNSLILNGVISLIDIYFVQLSYKEKHCKSCDMDTSTPVSDTRPLGL